MEILTDVSDGDDELEAVKSLSPLLLQKFLSPDHNLIREAYATIMKPQYKLNERTRRFIDDLVALAAEGHKSLKK